MGRHGDSEDRPDPQALPAEIARHKALEAKYDAACARFLDRPSVHLFCGETQVQHALPRARSSMTRLRTRIGPERLELLLGETLGAAQRAGAAEPRQ